MDREELLKEKRNLNNLKKNISSAKNYLSNADIGERLSKINYILSNDYLIDAKNDKLEILNSIMSNRSERIQACNSLINSINIRINRIEKLLMELDL